MKRLMSGHERLSVNGFSVHDEVAKVARTRQNQFSGEQFNAYMLIACVIAQLAVLDYY